MSERGLSPLDKGLTKICDSESGTVWVGDLVVNHRVDFDINVVTGDHGLTTDSRNLDLDINDANILSADVDLNQSWIHRFVKLSKTCDQSDRSLLDISEWIRGGAAWNSTTETNTDTECLHHGAINTMGYFPRTKILCIGRLHL